MNSPLPYLLTVCAVAAIAAGQILFKTTASRMAGRPLTESAVDPYVLLPFGIALVIYAAATVLWILALRDLKLGKAYMFMALSFVIVPAASAILFGEELTRGFFLGLALIIVGLVITQLFG